MNDAHSSLLTPHSSPPSLRYPGVRPFESNERHLFFGRARDIADLYDLVLLEKLLVLFGKSGYGKSSLLKAGIVPLFTELAADAAGQYPPVEVRLGSYVEGKSAAPLATLLSVLNERLPQQPGAEFLTPLFQKKTTLWHECQRRKAPKGGRALLIFDQFEEFFTYPQAERDEFCAQLSEALYEATPQNVRAQLDQFSATDRQFLAVPFDLKVVFSIRSDRLSLLDSMKGRLPAIFNKRYELRALDEKQARSAIVRPASLSADDGDFGTPSFTFADAALGIIVEKLATAQAGQGGRIESFQLQIVCQHLERQVQRGRIADRDGDGQPDIYPEDLPNFETVFEDYYHDKLSELPPADQQAARALIEDGLLFLNEATGEARRLSKDPGELVQTFGRRGVTPALLQQLEATYLLRREANTVGGYNYEISHDTLLAPIVKAAAARRQQEEQARLLAEAERQRQERRKIEVARRRNFAVGLAALALLVFAFYQTWQAQRAQQRATEMSQLAQKNEALATDRATEAGLNLKKAEAAQRDADLALADLEKQAAATEEQKSIARQNLAAADRSLALARQATADVVLSLLENAAESVRLLRYGEARATLLKAAGLGQRKPEVARALLEIAFFDHETGQAARADSLAGVIAGLLGPSAGPSEAVTSSHRLTTPGAFKKVSNLETLQPTMQTLRARYFGEMLPIPGGTFDLKNWDGSVAYRATLSPFRLASTETTIWQYNLYCVAKGRHVSERMYADSTVKKAGDLSWGWEQGDFPVVYINWYDAVEYCNWASERRGLRPAYRIEPARKDTNNQNSDRDDPYKWTVTLLPNANGYRLPTEAEWQYAATSTLPVGEGRGGVAGRDTFEYAGSDNLDEVGWYSDNSSNRAHAVKTRKPNGLGLYDLSGNLWEWCWDWYSVYPSELKTNWTGPERGSHRVFRGGSWGLNAGDCRVSYRNGNSPEFRGYYLGFRLASSPQ